MRIANYIKSHGSSFHFHMMTPFYFLLHFLVLDPLTRPRLRMHSGHNAIYSAASNVSLLKALKVTNCTVFSSLEGRRPVSFTTQKDSMALQTLSTKRVREFSESQFFWKLAQTPGHFGIKLHSSLSAGIQPTISNFPAA